MKTKGNYNKCVCVDVGRVGEGTMLKFCDILSVEIFARTNFHKIKPSRNFWNALIHEYKSSRNASFLFLVKFSFNIRSIYLTFV